MKRKLFEELKEGCTALLNAREGKVTLPAQQRTHTKKLETRPCKAKRAH